MEYSRDNRRDSNELDFKDYDFVKEPGDYDCVFVGRRFNKNLDLICCFRCLDGKQILAMAWKNKKYLMLDQIPIGSRVKLRFDGSASGRCYLRNVMILGEYKPGDSL